jgi:hypothetical protein
MPGFRVVSIHTEINSTQRRKDAKSAKLSNFLLMNFFALFASFRC